MKGNVVVVEQFDHGVYDSVPVLVAADAGQLVDQRLPGDAVASLSRRWTS